MKNFWMVLDSQAARLPVRASRWIALPVAAFALSACVTINIYFPAAAAEKAADKIIDEVWQVKKNDAEPSSKSVAPEAK